jgi:hypothetical protein
LFLFLASSIANWLEKTCEISHAKAKEYEDLFAKQDYTTVDSLRKTPPSDENLEKYGITVGRHRNAILKQIADKQQGANPMTIGTPILF